MTEMQPKGHHLAEVNIGRLVAAPDDPRLKDFVDNLDRINGIAKRMDGFVWMMEGEQGGNLDNPLGDDPRVAFNLSVWKDVESLDQYVWGTLHRQFYERRAEWFEVFQGTHFAMWWIPVGHVPTKAEAIERVAYLEANGDSDHAFGWSWLQAAKLWRGKGCSHVAAG
ncbi:MAG: DUF3291 domain-containing protein [Pseudomonadota bacterium]